MRRWATLLALVLAARSTQAREAAVVPSPAAAAPERRPQSAGGAGLARECFAAGVSLARAGKYSEARTQFLKAYAAKPHFIVLYDVALVDIQLGNVASAAQFLRLYLAEGNDAIVAGQRERIVREIARLDALSAGSVEATKANLRHARREAPAVVPRESVARATPGAVVWRPPAMGYVLVAGGFAALASAAAVHIWNHDRYLGWKARHEQLLALREGGPLPAEEEASLRARVSDANARLRSVQRFDLVPVVLAGLGALASGVGIWTLTEAHDDARVHLAAQPSELTLEASWRW